MPLPRRSGTNPFAGNVTNREHPAFTVPSQLRQDTVKTDYQQQAVQSDHDSQPDVDQQYQSYNSGLSTGVEDEQPIIDPFAAPINPLDNENTTPGAALPMPSSSQFQEPSPSPVLPQSSVMPSIQSTEEQANTPIIEDNNSDSLDSIGADSEPVKNRHGDHKRKTGHKRGSTSSNNERNTLPEPWKMSQPVTAPEPWKNNAGKATVNDHPDGYQTISIALLLLAFTSAVFGITKLFVSANALSGMQSFYLVLAEDIAILLFAVIGLVLGVISLARNKMKKAISVTAIILSIATITATVLLFFYGWTTVQMHSVADEKMQDISRCLGDSQDIISNGERDNTKWNCSNYSD